jgi:large subunit ribosomal protein L29
MSKKKHKEMKDMSAKDLMIARTELDREVFMLANELSVNRKLEKPHLLKAKRKERARVLTLLTLKQRGA